MAELQRALLVNLLSSNPPESDKQRCLTPVPAHGPRLPVAPRLAIPYAPGIVHNQAHLDAAIRLALASLQVTWWTGCVVALKAPALGGLVLACCIVFAVVLWKERTWRTDCEYS